MNVTDFGHVVLVIGQSLLHDCPVRVTLVDGVVHQGRVAEFHVRPRAAGDGQRTHVDGVLALEDGGARLMPFRLEQVHSVGLCDMGQRGDGDGL